MVNAHVAWERRKEWLRAVLRMPTLQESDMRYIAYTTPFDRPAEPANGDTGQNLPQQFPNGGTLVLGIEGSCIPSPPDEQPVNPFVLALDRFRVLFQYNANQSGLVVGNPQTIGGLASSVFSQYGDQFPAIEIPLAANDTILANVQNVTSGRIRGNLTYHCLIWKQGQ